jgi:hypothetical protein
MAGPRRPASFSGTWFAPVAFLAQAKHERAWSPLTCFPVVHN